MLYAKIMLDYAHYARQVRARKTPKRQNLSSAVYKTRTHTPKSQMHSCLSKNRSPAQPRSTVLNFPTEFPYDTVPYHRYRSKSLTTGIEPVTFR